MREVDKTGIEYIGVDIVDKIITGNNKYQSSNILFKKLDVTSDHLPQVDMIICRECLQHLSYNSIMRTLLNFKKSNTKYLLVSSFEHTWKNWDILDGDFRPLNIRKSPFKMGKPLYKINDTNLFDPHKINDKYMYLYDLRKLLI
jgi:hypothetical protein